MSTGTPSLSDAAGTWQLDQGATTVQIRTKAMWGLAKVKGTLKATEGTGTVSEDGAVTGRLVVDAASVDTKIKKRDDHLRGADFFEVEKFPSFTYEVTSVTPLDDGRFRVAGTLTVKDQTRPLELVASATQTSPDEAVLTTEAVIDRRDWGISWTKMGAGVQIAVWVAAHFNRA
jgi:polyisoprenoid-binding protein YceI